MNSVLLPPVQVTFQIISHYWQLCTKNKYFTNYSNTNDSNNRCYTCRISISVYSMHKNVLQLLRTATVYYRVGSGCIVVTKAAPLPHLHCFIWITCCTNKAVDYVSAKVLCAKACLEITVCLVILVCLQVRSGRWLRLLTARWQFLIECWSRNAKQFNGNRGCELSLVYKVECTLNQWAVDVFAARLGLCCCCCWLAAWPPRRCGWFLNRCTCSLLRLFLTLHNHHVYIYML